MYSVYAVVLIELRVVSLERQAERCLLAPYTVPTRPDVASNLTVSYRRLLSTGWGRGDTSTLMCARVHSTLQYRHVCVCMCVCINARQPNRIRK